MFTLFTQYVFWSQTPVDIGARAETIKNPLFTILKLCVSVVFFEIIGSFLVKIFFISVIFLFICIN